MLPTISFNLQAQLPFIIKKNRIDNHPSLKALSSSAVITGDTYQIFKAPVSPYNMNSTIYDTVNQVLSFVPLVTIALGLVFNTLCFIIFRFHPEFKKMSSMVYLSIVVVADTLSLFGWNLDHFTVTNFNIHMEFVNLFLCKFISFFQYFLLQFSGTILSMVSIDRFVTIRTTPGSFYAKLPFGTAKSACAWSLIIATLLFILNVHILILNGFYTDQQFRNRTLNESNETELYLYAPSQLKCYIYKSGFRLFPVWDQVHLLLYNFIPGGIMLVFNILLIKTTLLPSRRVGSKPMNSSDVNAARKKKNLTVSLLVVTFAFIIQTYPATVGFGYMSDYLFTLDHGQLTLNILDYFAFSYHVSMFFFTFVSHRKFRQIVVHYLNALLHIRPEAVSETRTETEANLPTFA